MNYKAGANTVAGDICGSLDLVRADPTAAINLQYRISKGHGGGGFIYIYDMRYHESNIASAIGYRGRNG